MKPTNEQFGAFQAMFDYFNKALFSGELPGVLLNFSRKVKNVGGFFAPKRWEYAAEGDKPGVIHEISLNPEYWDRRDAKKIVSIVVHEMVHLWQQEFGKIPRGGYHDKQWGERMEAIGLMPSNTAAPGGKRTGQQMSHYIIEGGLFDLAYEEMPQELLLPFVHVDLPPKLVKAKTKVKYTCRKCGTNVWGKPGVRVACSDCSEDYETDE